MFKKKKLKGKVLVKELVAVRIETEEKPITIETAEPVIIEAPKGMKIETPKKTYSCTCGLFALEGRPGEYRCTCGKGYSVM